MDCFENSPIFTHLQAEELQRIQNNQIQASCQFQIKIIKRNYQGSLYENSRHVLLQIRSKYIVQCDKTSQKIQSGAALNYSINFHIIEVNQQQKNNFDKNQIKQRCFLQIWNLNTSNQGLLSVSQPQDLYFTQFQMTCNSSPDFDNFKEVLMTKDIIHGIKDLKLLFKPFRCLGFKGNSKSYQGVRIFDKKKFIIEAHCLQGLKNHTDYHRLVCQFYIIQKLDHENIEKILNIFKTNNTVYIIKPYYNMNLTKFNKINGYNMKNIRKIMGKILLAIQFMHSNFIIHGNINTDNIIINTNNAKIIDITLTGFSNASIFYHLQHKKSNFTHLNPQKNNQIKFQHLASRDLQATAYLFYRLLTQKYHQQIESYTIDNKTIIQQMIFQLQAYGNQLPDGVIELFKLLLGISQQEKVSPTMILKNNFIRQEVMQSSSVGKGNHKRNVHNYQKQAQKKKEN